MLCRVYLYNSCFDTMCNRKYNTFWELLSLHGVFLATNSIRYLADIDHYIGLTRGESDCSCRPEDVNDCETCRLSWLWEDGTSMNYLNWTSTDTMEPQEGDCGRLTPTGWAENDCVDMFKYLCERKVRLFVIFVHLIILLNTCSNNI